MHKTDLTISPGDCGAVQALSKCRHFLHLNKDKIEVTFCSPKGGMSFYFYSLVIFVDLFIMIFILQAIKV